MKADEILREAWEAVERSGVPESVHEAAFREAVALIQADSASPGSIQGDKRAPKRRNAEKVDTSPTPPADSRPDEETFFARLAEESGVPQDDLRDILQLGGDGSVHVLKPARALGTSKAEQARTVVALVAGARAKGLGEHPVDGQAVRDEVKRRGCFDKNNYPAKVFGQLKGFNVGSKRNQVLPASKWVDDFKAAVAQAHGRSTTPDE